MLGFRGEVRVAVSFPRCAAACVGAVVGVSVLHVAGFAAMQLSPRVPRPNLPLQPLAQQARRLETTLSYLGQPLTAADHRLIDEALAVTDEEEGVQQIQTALDKYVLATVRINPESRVSVDQGPVRPELVENGTRLFLVKVLNEANVTARLQVASPNNGDVFIRSDGSPAPNAAIWTRTPGNDSIDVTE